MIFTKKNKTDLFLEQPIKSKSEDIWDSHIYAELISKSITEGARFIAIDGDFSSGKSSVLNLLKEKIESRKNIFLTVNFLSSKEYNKKVDLNGENNKINFDNNVYNGKKVNESTDKDCFSNYDDITNYYHRYFANQCINDICKNPYTAERIFYNNFFGLAVSNKKNRPRFNKFIDFILCVLIAFISVGTLYAKFFSHSYYYTEVKKVIDLIFPYVCFLTFILLILYGYGVYKPEEQVKSPMLDIDRTRNNLLKAIYTHIGRKKRLIFVIDDLDRLDGSLQKEIISLLYNEYYPLNKQFGEIEFCFVFMINLKDLSNVPYDYQKVFDYIINISSKQKYVISDYISKQIKQGTLEEIFSKCNNKDYLIELIINNFDDVRKVKHLFNNLISKFTYLRAKMKHINFDQLCFITISAVLDPLIEKKINKVINDDSSEYGDIIQAREIGMIDQDFYKYLYCFDTEENLYNGNEAKIYDILHDNAFKIENAFSEVSSILENKGNIRYRKIKDEIYPYISNDKKLIILSNLDMFNHFYTSRFFSSNKKLEVFKNMYRLSFSENVYNNIKQNFKDNDKFNINDIICSQILLYNRNLDDNPEDLDSYKKLNSELLLLIKNMGDSYLDFKDKKMFRNVGKISEELFNALYTESTIGWQMYLDNEYDINYSIEYLSDDSLKNINKFKNNTNKKAILDKLIHSKISYDNYKYIIQNYSDIVDINYVVKTMKDKLFKLDYELIEFILNKFGNSELLTEDLNYLIKDNIYIFKMLADSCDIKLLPSNIQEINSSGIKFKWKKYYLDQFFSNGFYDLYNYSELERTKLYKIKKANLNNKICNMSLYGIFINNNDTYDIDASFVDFVLSNGLLKDIVLKSSSSFIRLVKSLPKDKYDKVLVTIDNLSINNEVSKIIVNNQNIDDFTSIFYERNYDKLSPGNKSSLTKKINKSKSINYL